LTPRAAYRCAIPWVLSLAAGAFSAQAAPFTPSSDSQVLERLPLRANDPAARDLAALRQAWRAQPQDAGAAAALARRYVQEVAATGDPRYIGYAQAALSPWWVQAEAPLVVRVQRAVLRQFDHEFDAALVDLKAVLAADPRQAEAWSWRLAVEMVQADYTSARSSCEGLAAVSSALLAAACRAQVAAATGQAGPAAKALRLALDAAPSEDSAVRLWALTRLAEIEERLADSAAGKAQAEATFVQALALAQQSGRADVYLLAAYADFLLDQGRAAQVLTLLKDKDRADVLLLRLAIAAKTQNDSQAPALARSLASRFEAARLRGDTTHRKEQARFLLQVQGDAAQALPLAQANWAQQREVADAKLLLQAALANRSPQAAAPVLQWLQSSGLQSGSLQALAAQVRALPGVRK
jgi:hypothetical protein